MELERHLRPIQYKMQENITKLKKSAQSQMYNFKFKLERHLSPIQYRIQENITKYKDNKIN